MNIIKFKDVILNEDTRLTKSQNELFNSKFRNRYAYAINWVFCLALEDITLEQAVNLSELYCTNPDTISSSALDEINRYEWISLSLLSDYIDLEETMRINDVSKYIARNVYIPDTDITLDDVKPFRTWLATCILEMGTVEEYKTREMLKYYKGMMYDDTVRHLSEFNQVSTITSTTTSTCGCTKLPDTGIVGYCDAIQSYAKSVHNYMVQVFGDIDFWMNMDEDFLLDISKYIDTIIAYDLPLASSVWDDVLLSCGRQDTSLQKSLIDVLKNASKAFQYMAQREIEGNKNFIKTSLYEFCSKVYEKMYWV